MLKRTLFCRLLELTCFLSASVILAALSPLEITDPLKEWSVYRGDPRGEQYSELTQIHAANVHQLEPAWTYRTGGADKGTTIYSNSIVVDGTLFLTGPKLEAIALDAATGEPRWTFSPSEFPDGPAVSAGRNRGVTHWTDGEHGRIFHFVKNRVYALDQATGQPIPSFGQGGFIDLHENLGVDPASASVEVTVPGIVYEDFLIVGGRVPEGYRSTPGHIRAYDARTGAFRWIFHTLPQPGEFGYDTWAWQDGEAYGGANPWGGFTVDVERGWVFCATGSPSFDFYGANRKGMNLFGNCVLALNARTGERIWHYQTVHHDLWDFDNPPAPMLVTVRDGKAERDVVVQMTKMGLIFVLDRETGEPVFPVDEVPVPASTVPGEQAWPTQPVPQKPKPLSRWSISAEDLFDATPERAALAQEAFRQYRNAPIYTPPSLVPSLMFPGTLGGIQWHGASYDWTSNLLYVTSHDIPGLLHLVPEKRIDPETATPAELGRHLYLQNCAACHGLDRAGVPPAFPSLLDTPKSDNEIIKLIVDGRGLMPGFPNYTEAEQQAVLAFLQTDPAEMPADGTDADEATRYVMSGYHRFTDADGAPWIKPPYGKLSAVDLRDGEIKWEVPLGEYPHLVEQGIRNTGTMNFGGAVATAGGVIFVAATADEKIRAFEKNGGRQLWEFQLPHGGYATPSIYEIDGRQFVVIACGGGGKIGTPSGDTIMAFALPERTPPSPHPDGTWIELFDGETLDGWARINGYHDYTVEGGAIIGRTVDGSPNSFLCSSQEFGDFEMELEVMIDDVTNSGIQFRSGLRPTTIGEGNTQQAGRVWGPQVEIRRNLKPGSPTTGVLYAEAMGSGWMSARETIDRGHDHLNPEGWNQLRIQAVGPRIQTWVNGHLVEDLINEEIYQSHPRGFIGLQIHGINGARSFTMGWRNIRIRPL